MTGFWRAVAAIPLWTAPIIYLVFAGVVCHLTGRRLRSRQPSAVDLSGWHRRHTHPEGGEGVTTDKDASASERQKP